MRLAALVVALAAAAPPAADGRVLVFTRAEGFVHPSIADGARMLRSAGARVTSDPRSLRRLARYDALVFLSTTGDVLDRPAERAVERFVRGGGGWLGIHAAADAERGWRFYQRELLGGADFAGHPPGTPRATVVVADAGHPAVQGVPRRWTRADEWYAFRARPRAHVVLTRDGRPLAWGRRVGRGRAFYTALGHTPTSYAEPAFRRHVRGALRWAQGAG